MTTEEAGAMVAYALEAAGDSDADGDQDVAVGFTPYRAGGSVWLLTPTPGERLDISAAEVGVFHERAEASVGMSLAAGRDVNGDGQVDLVVGAPGVDFWAGEVRVFWGPITGVEPWDAAEVIIAAEGDDRDIGTTVDVVDDVDADGIPELFIPRRAGACFMGAAVAGDYRTTDAPLQVLGTGSWVDTFGYATGTAVVTDLDADGNVDLVVGNGGTSVNFEGILTVLRGPVSTGVRQEDANQWWHGGLYEGMGAENRLVGDTDGDGRPEMLTTTYDYYGGGYILLVDGADVR